MKLVPAINVSTDGRITLRNGSPTLLIDGKRTNLTLDQIPADQIDRVEIITAPTARCDAQGNSGIVNIVLKQNEKPGVNGNILRIIDQAITVVSLPLSGDTLLQTYVNARSNSSYGLELTARVSPARWSDVTLNINLLQSDISVSDAAAQASNQGFNWFGKCNAEFRPGKGYTLQVNGVYQGPQVLPQGKKAGTGYIDLSAARNLAGKRWSVLLTLTNLLNSSRDQVITGTAGQFVQTALTRPLTRVVKIGCTYRLGGQGPRKGI